MSDRENSRSPSGSNHSEAKNGLKEDKKSRSRSRDREDKNNAKSRRTRSRSPRKMSYKGSRYRSRSRSPRRKSSRRSYSRSRSRSYSPKRRGDRRSYSHSPMSSRRRHQGTRDNPQPSRCLGVFGLSIYTTEQELHHILSKYGPVERVQVVIDAKTGRSRGFAFCYFENAEDAKIAKEQCTGMEIDGRRIRVDFSITQRAHTPTPGIYMGRPTFSHRDRDRGWGRERDDYYGSSYRSSYRRSPSPYYRKSRRYERSRSRSYSPPRMF